MTTGEEEMKSTIQPPGPERILALAQKYTFAEAAAMLGVNERTFSKWYRDVAKDTKDHKSGPRPIPAPSKQALLETLRTNTNQETADYYGVGYKTLARWLREYGILDRLFDQEQMLSLADAAREVKVSRMAMSNWFRQGMIPGARKINGTRVVVPAASVETLKTWRRTWAEEVTA